MDKKVDIQSLKELVQKFCEERDWDGFHGAKDLAIGAVTEASELLEIFRFQSPQQVEEILNDESHRQHVGEELADVLFFILRFSQRYEFDLSDCFVEKMKKNALRYPAEEFTGKNHKSTVK